MNAFKDIMQTFRVNVLLIIAAYIYLVLHLANNVPEKPEVAALVFGLAGVVVGIGAGAAKDLLAPPPPVEVPIKAHAEVTETNRLLAVKPEVLVAKFEAEKAQAEARAAEAKAK